MKKKTVLAVMAFIPVMAFCQERQRVYCEMIGIKKFLSTKCNVRIDFGKGSEEDTRIVESDGSLKTFNSMVEAMNYMARLGWKFEQAYVAEFSKHGSSTHEADCHWLLSKEIGEGERADEGILMKKNVK